MCICTLVGVSKACSNFEVWELLFAHLILRPACVPELCSAAFASSPKIEVAHIRHLRIARPRVYTPAPMAGTPPTQGGRRRSVGIMPVERRACDIPRSTNMLRSNLTIEQRVELLGWEGDTVHPTPFTKSDEARAKAMLKEEREKLRKDRMQK